MAKLRENSRSRKLSWLLLQLLTLHAILHLSGVTCLQIQLPVALSKFNFESLPVYCKGSTMHFECRDDTGSAHCLPLSLKCRIQCANDAELNCPNSAMNCTADQYRCAATEATAPGAPVCMPDELLCDGRAHCPAGDDESRELCLSRRTCPQGRFACRSAGHCLPAGRRCDGHPDCLRPGLDDRSDEADCPTARPGEVTSDCPDDGPDAFRCADGSGCVRRSYVCDGFPDCADSSDEVCAPVACGPGKFDCDGRCLSAQLLRCDGRVDCKSGADELDCQDHPGGTQSVSAPCSFSSDFRCRWSGACVSRIFLCDGTDDCKGGTAEDEICPVNVSEVCQRPDYWTCASATHCVPASARCDGLRHCPDASDETNCQTPTSATNTAEGAAVTKNETAATVTSSSTAGITSMFNAPGTMSPGLLTAAIISAAVVAALLAGGAAVCIRRRFCRRQSVELEGARPSIGENKKLLYVYLPTPLTSSTVVSECRDVA